MWGDREYVGSLCRASANLLFFLLFPTGHPLPDPFLRGHQTCSPVGQVQTCSEPHLEACGSKDAPQPPPSQEAIGEPCGRCREVKLTGPQTQLRPRVLPAAPRQDQEEAAVLGREHAVDQDVQLCHRPEDPDLATEETAPNAERVLPSAAADAAAREGCQWPPERATPHEHCQAGVWSAVCHPGFLHGRFLPQCHRSSPGLCDRRRCRTQWILVNSTHVPAPE